MKFQKDVYCSIGTCIQKFINRHALFVFFITFRKDVAAWNWISHVAPVEAQMIHFEVFITWYGRAFSTPKQYHFLDYAVENKYMYMYFGRSSKKESLSTVRL